MKKLTYILFSTFMVLNSLSCYLANIQPPEKKRKIATVENKEIDYITRDNICEYSSGHVDLNEDGFINFGDAFFLGEEIQGPVSRIYRVYIHKFRFFYTLRDSNGELEPVYGLNRHPDSTWYDFDNDGRIDYFAGRDTTINNLKKL